MKNSPNYKVIFLDIIAKKFPDKKNHYNILLDKTKISAIEVMKINNIIFNLNSQLLSPKQVHRSYSKSDIMEILAYQRINKINNSQLAKHFGMSRNTIAKWKRVYYAVHLTEH